MDFNVHFGQKPVIEYIDQIPLGRYKDLLLTSAGVAARLGTKPDLYVYDAPRT
ncbi:hypothetical protein [Ralstonia phage phiRSL1]|uniref:Uncharacterized protein n=1 Tax=Ralstonia phage phiRSL1 TaxID=1980924 RepID=B2ZY79_9CAUD|nr:hypothetical protein RSL1_ORF267 [Ralstonia phage phiRSL1]BAG41714.1 hypothetical protein [Ralstonia phage phiRSL1]